MVLLVGDVYYVLCQLEMLGLVCQQFFLCVECYEYCVGSVLDLICQQLVVLGLLLLCGLQMVNELLICSECLFQFQDVDELWYYVECMIQCGLVVQLLCVSGQCEDCYMYLLVGLVDVEVLVEVYKVVLISGGGGSVVLDVCVQQLEVIVVELQEQLVDLCVQLGG